MAESLALGALAPKLEALDPLSGSSRPLQRPNQPTLLTFLRGTWCPTCRHFLDQIQPAVPQVVARGVEIVAVACQGRHWVSSYLQVHPLPFPLLCDESREVAKAFGVYKLLGLDGVNIARPATFVLDAGGRVAWSHIGQHMLDRPTNEAVLAALDGLRAPASQATG